MYETQTVIALYENTNLSVSQGDNGLLVQIEGKSEFSIDSALYAKANALVVSAFDAAKSARENKITQLKQQAVEKLGADLAGLFDYEGMNPFVPPVKFIVGEFYLKGAITDDNLRKEIQKINSKNGEGGKKRGD
ncbi:MAG TPA: hypothetical protein P5282_05715 [Anaerolineaceae bacterium]|nr:hypothetical protein [Myxococcota bacterium]HRS74417.1 hypothetical protein [Anaerolineaceae bacterium]HRV17898.1 hypothetical protein [Myxococcota bacterium]